ncbi:hypothetical protein [Cupriavidus alkaliphilus]|uniref:hypothetical protein n=1 Tax=Cupriavidus alkaliphilus TaxID=942866 RepID=UPI00339D7ABD
MNYEDLVDDLNASLQVISDSGRTAISPAGIRTFLSEERGLITSVTAQEAQLREQNRKNLILTAGATEPSDSYKAAIEAGQTAINTAILLNGTAAVAFLVFLGNILIRTAMPNLGLMSVPLILFALGVFRGARASFQRYRSQDAFTDVHVWAFTGEQSRDERDMRWRLSKEFEVKAVSNCHGSLLLFLCGIAAVFYALALLHSTVSPAPTSPARSQSEPTASTTCRERWRETTVDPGHPHSFALADPLHNCGALNPQRSLRLAEGGKR